MPSNPSPATGTLPTTPEPATATLPTWWSAAATATLPTWWWAAAIVALLLAWLATLIALTHTYRRARTTQHKPDREPERAQRVMYLVALLGIGVSADTSWRFFGQVLGITGWERVAMFAVLEVAMIACGVVMRANARAGQPPGQARTFLWLLTAGAVLAAYMLSGIWTGAARVFFGPVIGIWALHIGLGIDLRAAQRVPTGTWERISAELRQRVLSRLGLGNENRDALALRQDRAARRAARLAIELNGPTLSARARTRRLRRLQKAISTANVAHDPRRRAVLLAELAALTHVDDLIGLQQPSPWTTAVPAAPAAPPRQSSARRAPRPTNGHVLSSRPAGMAATDTPAVGDTATTATADTATTATADTATTATADTTTATADTDTADTDTADTDTADTDTADTDTADTDTADTDTADTDTADTDTTDTSTADTADTAATTGSPRAPSTRATATEPRPRGLKKIDRMRQMFERYVREGRVDELRPIDLAHYAGASGQLGRKYLPKWKAELGIATASATTATATTSTETDPR